jgi:hypothetical protein
MTQTYRATRLLVGAGFATIRQQPFPIHGANPNCSNAYWRWYARQAENTATINRAFVITDKERMALVSNLTANGDHTIILKGGNVPFVHGKKPETSESDIRYQLVSDAYFHGITNGEAFQAFTSRGDEIPWQDIGLV